MSNRIPNIGWLFYKDYYRDLEQALKKRKGDEPLELGLERKNNAIFGQKLEQYDTSLFSVQQANYSLSAKTRYPGLLAGTGVSHIIKDKEELKLGFSFDHTTGLPYLPASSVKGLLRSYFPSRLRNAAKSHKQGSPERKALEWKATQLSKLMVQLLLPKDIRGNISEDKERWLLLLEEHIFEGKDPAGRAPQSIYNRDIFFDAYPLESAYQGRGNADRGRFLGKGAITPHGKDLFKEPNPISFLKVLPEVVFRFPFRLTESVIGDVVVSPFHKYLLFKEIITRFGVGAKTNVGYGRMEEES